MSTPPQVPQIKWDDAPEIKWDDAPAVGATPTGTISPTHATYLQKLEGDVRHGTATTIPGKVLQMMGARGTDTGVSPGAAEQGPASLPLGVIKAMQGVQEGSPLKALGGAMQAGSLPAAFLGGPKVALDAGEVLNKVPVVGRVFASSARAGQNLNEVNHAIGQTPFPVTDRLSNAALAVQKEAELGGGNVPQVVRKFIARVTNPEKPALNFEDARRFASNASGLTVSEWFNMLKNGNMRRLLGEFHGAFGEATQTAADSGGMGDRFAQAMQEYHQAMQNKAALATALGGSALYRGRKALKAAGDALLGH